YLIEIAARVCGRDPNTYILLVGDGLLRPQIKQMVDQNGLAERVIFAGLRSNIPQIMLVAMDCFVFPSLFEGLGIVLIEAQAAGLPCLYSDVVPQEVVVFPKLMHARSLKETADDWADAVLAYKQ